MATSMSFFIAAIILLLGSLFAPVARDYSSPFVTFRSDGCTIIGLLYMPPWESACYHHDIAYWYGGPWYERVIADWRLAVHIFTYGKWHIIEAAVVFLFLLFFGGYPWPWRHYRWGGGVENKG